MGRLLAAALSAIAISWSASALAQDWPARPLTMVVPFAPGGPVDVLGRVLQPYLSETLGQQVVVENVPGAGGMMGAQRVARAAADSHVFVLGSVGTHAIGMSTHRKPAYDAAAD